MNLSVLLSSNPSILPSFNSVYLEVFLELAHYFFLKLSIVLGFFGKNFPSAKMTKKNLKWGVGFILWHCFVRFGWSFYEIKVLIKAVTFCKNCISVKILVHKWLAKMHFSNKNDRFFDHHYLWNESTNQYNFYMEVVAMES